MITDISNAKCTHTNTELLHNKRQETKDAASATSTNVQYLHTNHRSTKICNSNNHQDSRQLDLGKLSTHQQICESPPPTPVSSSTVPKDDLGFQLRALTEQIEGLKANPWDQLTNISQKLNVSSLSTELVNETLNYFINCGQRLSQMTKTYDDSEAYLLMLQEKEVDLELAARIGQDLLEQNKSLKNSVKRLEDELTKRQDDVQQLKYELANKASLLDTLIEEEEQNTSLSNADDDTHNSKQEILYNVANVSSNNQAISVNHKSFSQAHSPHPDTNSDNEGSSGFISLNYSHRAQSSSAEPFSSLPHYLGTNGLNGIESRVTSNRDDAASSCNDDDVGVIKQNETQTQLIESVTFQLVESNKRLCELQDELLYKGEQNMIQQEKVYNLQELLRDSERQMGALASENEALQRAMSSAACNQKELLDELQASKRNFSELFEVFLELQKESRRNDNLRNLQQSSQLDLYGDVDAPNDTNNISYDSYNATSNNNTNEASCMQICSLALRPTMCRLGSAFNLLRLQSNNWLQMFGRELPPGHVVACVCLCIVICWKRLLL